MKKIFFAVVSLTMMLLSTSCDNDEIQIDKVGRKYNLSLDINTQSMYDEFQLTSTIRETHLRDGSRVVGVHTYLFDAEGNFVENKNEYLSNFNTTSVQFDKLVEGSYTVITIETLVNPDNNYQADTWSFDDYDKISTFKITNKYEDPDEDGYRWKKIAVEPEVIGVVSRTFSLGKDTEAEITPKAIGSVVQFNSFNWEKSSYATIGWATNDVLDYYSLNPALNRSNRFVKSLTESGKTHVRRLFDVDEDPTRYYQAYVLEAEMSWKCVYQSNESIATGNVYVGNPRSATLEDGKTYQIGVYYTNDGFFTYFGDQAGLASWKSDLDSQQQQQQQQDTELFAKPYTNWSTGTVAAVKSFMTNFTLYQEPTFSSSSNMYEMIYFDSNYNIYEYDFKTATSGLTDSWVFFSDDNVDLTKVREAIEKQGFAFHSQNGNNYYFTGTDTYVTLYKSDSGTILINYYDPKAYGMAPKRTMPEDVDAVVNNSRRNKVRAAALVPFSLRQNQLIKKLNANTLK